MNKTNRRLIVLAILVLSLFLSACDPDTLSDYEGSLWSPTVGDMIYIEAAHDPFMFGKAYQSPHIEETLSYNFLISQYEVTNEAFQEFIDDGGYTSQTYWTDRGWDFITRNGYTEPAYWSDPAYNAPNQPVVGISWYEAVAFTNWLSHNEGWRAAYERDGSIVDFIVDGYRLPTEVEWEYVASKGDPSESERTYAWGNTWYCNRAVDRVPPCNNYVSGPEAVGGRSPDGDTPQGIADMTGNVAEMMSDTWQDGGVISTINVMNRYHYDVSVLLEGVEGFTVLRGGAWNATVGGVCETTYRRSFPHTSRADTVGFRVVRVYPGQTTPAPELGEPLPMELQATDTPPAPPPPPQPLPAVTPIPGCPEGETCTTETFPVYYCHYIGDEQFEWYEVMVIYLADGTPVNETILSGPYTGPWRDYCPGIPEDEPETRCACEEVCIRPDLTTGGGACLEWGYRDCNGELCEP